MSDIPLSGVESLILQYVIKQDFIFVPAQKRYNNSALPIGDAQQIPVELYLNFRTLQERKHDIPHLRQEQLIHHSFFQSMADGIKQS